MAFLVDFGISQEDFHTEEAILRIREGDHILSLASAGEVPLCILSTHDNIRLTAVDISEKQIFLTKLKLTSALQLDFPVNGRFLGYGKMDSSTREEIYRNHIRAHLTTEESAFWDSNLKYLKKGVINAGRFEHYINQLRFLLYAIIGKKNITDLINSNTTDDQIEVFDRKIAGRKSLQWLFKIAFHPVVYRKRGLQEQALIHADQTTGERFYAKFRNFCTATPASGNYFLQYFLTGYCSREAAFPSYLKSENKPILISNLPNFELINSSFQTEITRKEKGYYTKIHMSNLGDWTSETDFDEFILLLQKKLNPGTRICYRYLQKNYFEGKYTELFDKDVHLATSAALSDRFPFYGVVALIMK